MSRPDVKDRLPAGLLMTATRGVAPVRSLFRHAVKNRDQADACQLWAFASLTRSPGARRYYDTIRSRGKTHHQALRQLANRLVGILHACLEKQELYDEQLAWPTNIDEAAA